MVCKDRKIVFASLQEYSQVLLYFDYVFVENTFVNHILRGLFLWGKPYVDKLFTKNRITKIFMNFISTCITYF